MKYKAKTIALMVFLSLTLSACTIQDLPVIGKLFGKGGGIGTSGPITLNVWGLWENPEVMKKLIDKYQEAHPNVTVNYDDRSVMKMDDYKDRIFSSASQTLDADVVMIHNGWVNKLKSALVPAPEATVPIQTYTSSFYPVARDSGIVDGKVYAMPLYYDGLALIYNKKDFEEAGQAEPPTSWEEFRTLAIKLTSKSGGVMTRAGAAMGAADNIDFFSDILGLMWSQAGVEIPAGLDSKSAADALKFYTDFIKIYGVWDRNMTEASTAFANEKVSMIFAPSWILSDILEARPNLQVGVAPVPQAILDQPVAWGSFWMTAVPVTSTHPDVAWDFINFLSQEDQQLMLFNENSSVRKLASPFSLVSLNSQLSTNPYLKPYVDTASFARGGVMSARAGNKTQIDLLKKAVNSVLDGTKPEDALNVMVNTK